MRIIAKLLLLSLEEDEEVVVIMFYRVFYSVIVAKPIQKYIKMRKRRTWMLILHKNCI